MNITATNIYILFFIIVALMLAIILYRITITKMTPSNKPINTITKSIVVEGFSFGSMFKQFTPTTPPPAKTANTLIIPQVSAPLLVPDAFVEPTYNADMENASWDIYTEIKTIKEMNQLNLGPQASFCNSYVGGVATNSGCEQLTESNCKKVGCCVYTSSNKCVAGSSSGPIYPQQDPVDYYYYKNKCYGAGCNTLSSLLL